MRDMRKILSMLTPLLLHQAVALAAAFVFRICAEQYAVPYDATLVVLVGNLIVIPIAARMYRRDGRDEFSTRAAVHGETFSAGTAKPEKVAVPGMECMPKTSVSGMGRWQAARFGLLCFIGGGALNLAWSSVLNLLQIQTRFSNQVQEQLLAANPILQVVGLGIVAPVAEELIFRGLTYRRMRRLFSVWAAVFLSALLFAVYHGNLVQMIFAFPMAIVLALVYERGKWLLFPLLFHMGSNLTAIFLTLFL